MPNDVDAKTIDAALKPKAHHVIHRGANLGIPPIQVWLGAEERVVIILAGCLVVLPRAPPELGTPVVRSASVGRRIAPDVPVAFLAVARATALQKPPMLIRGVIGDEVKNDLQASVVCRRQQLLEIIERAE